MTAKAYDGVKVEWTGTGTGTMTLGPAVSGFDPFPAELDGEEVAFLIEHQGAGVIQRENAVGIYTHSGTTLSRLKVTMPASGALTNFSAGLKHVSIVPTAADFKRLGQAIPNHRTIGSYPEHQDTEALAVGARRYVDDVDGVRRIYVAVDAPGTTGTGTPPTGETDGQTDGTVTWDFLRRAFFTEDANNPPGSAGVTVAGHLDPFDSTQFYMKVTATEDGAVRLLLPTVWETGFVVGAGGFKLSDGGGAQPLRVYQTLTGGTTGATPPSGTSTAGDISDGGVTDWVYRGEASDMRREFQVEKSSPSTEQVKIYGIDSSYHGEKTLSTNDTVFTAFWSPEGSHKWERGAHAVKDAIAGRSLLFPNGVQTGDIGAGQVTYDKIDVSSKRAITASPTLGLFELDDTNSGRRLRAEESLEFRIQANGAKNSWWEVIGRSADVTVAIDGDVGNLILNGELVDEVTLANGYTGLIEIESNLTGDAPDVSCTGGFVGAKGTALGQLDMAGQQIVNAHQSLADDEETASFTLALAHAQQEMVRCNHATVAITATIPLNASVAFPIGTVITLNRWGAAAVTIAAAGGVTLNQPSDRTAAVREQYEVVSLWKQGTDTWLLFGGLAST